MLKRQHFELLKLLETEKNLLKLAEKMSLSERSIRYKIDEINEKLRIESKIEIKKRQVYSVLTNMDLLKLLDEVEDNDYIYSQKEREELIILYTLFKKDTFLLKEIADKLNTSKSTIRNDIKNIKKYLVNYNINLLQDDKLKYYYDYLEEDYRYFITIFLYKYISFDREYSKLFYADLSYFKKLIYNEIREDYMLEIERDSEIMKRAKLLFMDETLNILVILMVVARKRESKFKKLEVQNKNILIKRYEYRELKTIFSSYSEDVILFCTDYLFRIGRDEKDIFIKLKNWIDIIVAINKIVRNFEIKNKVELRNIDTLLNQIFYYIKPLIFRSIKGIELKNSILKEVKELYPEIFTMLREEFYMLEDVIESKISDEELAYITPFFYKALQEYSKNNKRAILITNHKENIALFLKEEIETEYLIDIVEIVTLKMLDKIIENLDKYDYVLATFKIDKILKERFKKLKVIELNPILVDDDRKKFEKEGLIKSRKIKLSKLLKVINSNAKNIDIKNLLADLNKNFYEEIYNDIEKGKFFLGNFLSKDNIYNTSVSNLKELLEIFLKLSFLKKNDINDIINKIKINSFYSFLGNKVAIIFHRINKLNENDNILVAINDKTIKVNDEECDLIVIVNSNCGIKYRGIVYNFVKLFYNNNFFDGNNNRLKIYDYLISNI